MLLVFGCHDYGNGYFYRMRIWISYGNKCYYLTIFSFFSQFFESAPVIFLLASYSHMATKISTWP
jgi:hypothetical protein